MVTYPWVGDLERCRFIAVIGLPRGSEPGFRRPVVVLQGDLFNAMSLATVVICALANNPVMAHFPGNVVLASGKVQ